jgi:hypothetical protein
MKSLGGLRLFVFALLCLFVSKQGFAEQYSNSSFSYTVNVGSQFSINLTTLLSNQGSGTLLWQASGNVPSWLTIDSATSTMSGTPLAANAGSNTFSLAVSDNDPNDKGSIALITVNVIPVPVWTQNPINLGTQPIGVAFSLNLSTLVTIQGGGALIFSVNGTLPSWLTLTSAGVLSGTPGASNLGTYGGFSFVAQSGAGASAQAPASGQVIDQAPSWSQNPITLADATQSVLYSATLSSYAVDKNANATPLVFSKVSGPAWATINSNGTVSGTPAATDIGVGEFQVQFTDQYGLTAQTNVFITVDKLILAPVWSENPIPLPNGLVGTPYSFNLAPLASDPNGLPLAFSLVSGPSWMMVSAGGQITGTPGPTNVGAFTAVFQVTNGTLTANVNAFGTVYSPISFTANPINLPNATETISYSQGLSSYVTDANSGVTFSFTKVSGNAWANVQANGTITGTPAHTDVGSTSIVVMVTDSLGLTATTTVDITVVKTPPRWLQNPIPLGSINATKPFTFNLATYAVGDGDTLTYSLVSGPSWMSVSSTGQITGTPPNSAAGSFTATFQVADGTLTATAQGVGTVVPTVQPPVISETALHFTVTERQTLTVNLAQPQYVSDPQNGTMTFTLTTAATWATLSGAGVLTLTPVFQQVGNQTLGFTVTDQQSLTSTGIIYVTVLGILPVWNVNPINMTAYVNQPFSGTLAGDAQDLDNQPITYSLVSAPSWLTVAANGALSGTPPAAGTDTFTVGVTNQTGTADATLIITVSSEVPVQDKVVVDAGTGTTENLWVIENPAKRLGQDPMPKSLEDNISCYYDALTAAQVSSTGVYLSSDGTADGKPILSQDSSKTLFLLGSNPSVSSDFACRTESFRVQSCDNSPIWSMWDFYQSVPTTPAYTTGYFVSGVPMDVLVVGRDADEYQTFDKGTAEASYTPTDFAKSFTALHTQMKKPYRISAIAPECSQDGVTPQFNGVEDSYKELASSAGGTFYPYDCNFDMCSTLKSYASDVIFRAKVYGIQDVKLSKTPDVSTIKVLLAGNPLTGNTGSATDAWEYDATNKQIVLNWMNIDISQLKSGDVLEVDYMALATQLARK